MKLENPQRIRDPIHDLIVFQEENELDLAASPTVLELAATAHWLLVHEKRKDWELELRRRKGVKLESGREKQALDLLKSLKLQPAA